jgi:hypothetical protein
LRDGGIVQRYEDLRASGDAAGVGLGRALLMSRGVAAWMAAWSGCVSAVDQEPQCASRGRASIPETRAAEVGLLPGLPAQAVRILAEMARVVAWGNG